MTYAKLSNAQRLTSAGLLLTLPAVTTAASYAHGHGSLSGAMLGLIVTLAIAAGAWGAGLLLQKGRSAQEQRTRDLILHLSR